MRPVLLALRALHIGDLLAAVPALRALRRHWPEHLLVLATPGGLAPVVELTGCVDIVWPVAGLRLPDRSFDEPDVAVNLHGRGPQSNRLLDSLSPRLRVGHAGSGWPGPAWREDQHERTRWCRMLAAHGLAADPADLRLRVPDTAPPMRDAAVVSPGATYPSRRWPLDRFAEVAADLARSRQVVVVGTAAERDQARAVAGLAGLPDSAVLAGRTGLAELAALVASAEVVVTADSGVAHLTYAYRTPSVVLFGPVPAKHWGPPAGGPHVALSDDARRHGDPFADTPDPALLGVSVADVLTALRRLPRSATAHVG